MEAPFRTHIHCLLQHTEPTESEVTATSLKNLSLTCKKTRQICSPIIFRTMAICFAVESLSNLYRVSLTPYAGMVREIRYGGPILLKSGFQDWDTFQHIYPKSWYKKHRDLGYWTDKTTKNTMNYASVHCAMSRVYREQEQLMTDECVWVMLTIALPLLPNLCSILLDLQNEENDSFKPSKWLFKPRNVQSYSTSVSAFNHLSILLDSIWFAKHDLGHTNIHVKKFELRGFRLSNLLTHDPESFSIIAGALDGVLDLKMGYHSALPREDPRNMDKVNDHHLLLRKASKSLRSLSLEYANIAPQVSISPFNPVCRDLHLPEFRDLKITNQTISYPEFERFMVRHARNMTSLTIGNVVWIEDWAEDRTDWEIAYENKGCVPPPAQMLQSLAKIGKATLLQAVKVTATVRPECLDRVSLDLGSFEMLLKRKGALFDTVTRQIG